MDVLAEKAKTHVIGKHSNIGDLIRVRKIEA